jgi:hypothetical protein
MSHFEQGTASGSPVVHAGRRTLQGLTALCDGRRLEPVSGRFDAAAAEACPECVTAADAR